MFTMAFGTTHFFEYELPRIHKKYTISLRALDLANTRLTDKLPHLFSHQDNYFALDCIHEEIIPRHTCSHGVPIDTEKTYEDAANNCLRDHMNLYEERYFLFNTMNDSPKIGIATVERTILKYLDLYRKFHHKRGELDIFSIYIRISNLMFEKNITNGDLWSMLFEELYLKDVLVPCLYLETSAMKMEFILNILKKCQTSFKGDDYLDLQVIVSVDSCLIFGSLELLKMLLQMGHESSWEQVQIQFPHYWMAHCNYSLSELDLIKPKNMTMRRYLLHLHIFDYAIRENFVGMYEEFPEMLELLWRAIPDSIITKDEVITVLAKDLQDESPDTIDQIFEEWDDMFCNSPIQPRKLQHYARCVIRRKLNLNFKLPEGIYQLPLPKDLQSYLNLER